MGKCEEFKMGADEEKYWCGCHGVRMVKDRIVSIIVTIARSSLWDEHTYSVNTHKPFNNENLKLMKLSLSRQLYVNTVTS